MCFRRGHGRDQRSSGAGIPYPVVHRVFLFRPQGSNDRPFKIKQTHQTSSILLMCIKLRRNNRRNKSGSDRQPPVDRRVELDDAGRYGPGGFLLGHPPFMYRFYYHFNNLRLQMPFVFESWSY